MIPVELENGGKIWNVKFAENALIAIMKDVTIAQIIFILKMDTFVCAKMEMIVRGRGQVIVND